MTKYTADEVREAIRLMEPKFNHTLVEIRLLWAAGEYLKAIDPKTDTFCKGCEGYQAEIEKLMKNINKPTLQLVNEYSEMSCKLDEAKDVLKFYADIDTYCQDYRAERKIVTDKGTKAREFLNQNKG